MKDLNQCIRAIGFVLLSIFVLAGSPAVAAEDDGASGRELILLASTTSDDDVNDPLESINRWIFAFNEFIQDIFFRPIATLYNDTVPEGARTSIGNFLRHISMPVNLANNILQGDPEGAMTTLGRFVVNSTAGIGGLVDVAGEAGMERRSEDFGQTLGVWGMGEGFYLVLPIFGPSNPRDAIGKFGIDPFFDPLGLYLSNTDKDSIAYTRTGVSGLDKYASVVDELNQVKKTSVDYYAAIRSLYRQKRKSEIVNGDELELPPIPDLDLSYSVTPEDFNQPLAGAQPPVQ